MKQKLCAALLCVALMLGLCVSAGAYYMTDTGQPTSGYEMQKFWQDNYARFQEIPAQQVVQSYAINAASDFQEDLLVIEIFGKDEMSFNYLDRNMNVVDLNRGRFWYVYDFSEGLAAGLRTTPGSSDLYSHVSYFDHDGNIVIDLEDVKGYFSQNGLFTGKFIDGKAVVINGEYYNSTERIRYAYIDTSGKMLTKWKQPKNMAEVCALPLYNEMSVWIGDYSFEGYEPDHSYWGQAEQGAAEEEKPFVPEYHAPALPDFNRNAPSLFASTAKVTGFHLGDLDFGSGEVTITNPTQLTDAGVVAVSFVNVDGSNFDADGDGVFFVSYELAPGESRAYSVDMTGIINQSMFTPNAFQPYATQLDGHVDSTIWMFENEADLVAFYRTIPYEQHWYPRNLINEFQPICDDQLGTDWLRQMADTVRQPSRLELYDYYLPDGSRLNGAEADHAGYCHGQ